jgi:hypothetical protein
MTDEEVEIVAEELAKIGGTAWYPRREPGPLIKGVTDNHQDRPRAAIAALDQFNAPCLCRNIAGDNPCETNKSRSLDAASLDQPQP